MRLPLRRRSRIASIVLVDLNPRKREAAAARASEGINGAGTQEEVARRLTAACGGAVEAVIALVGAGVTARAGFASLRQAGTLVLVGLYGRDLSLPLPIMATRAFTVRGSYVGTPKELREVVALVRAGRLPPIPIATTPLGEAKAALERLKSGAVVGRLVLVNDGRF